MATASWLSAPVDFDCAIRRAGVLVLSTTTADKLPVGRPHAGVSQEVDQQPRVAGVRRLEDDRQRAVVFGQQVLGQTAAAKNVGGFGSVQPLDELLVLSLMSSADTS